MTPSGGAKVIEEQATLDGANEEDVLIILNKPVSAAGYATSLDVTIKSGAIGSDEDLLDANDWPYARDGLPEWHALVYERVELPIPGFRLVASTPVKPKATLGRQSVSIPVPLRVEVGMYLGISAGSAMLCYGKEPSLDPGEQKVQRAILLAPDTKSRSSHL